MSQTNTQLPFISIKFKKGYLYIFIYWILEVALSFLKSKYSEDYKLSNKKSENEYCTVISNVVADLLAGFLVLITKCTMSSPDNFFHRERSNNNIGIDLIHNDIVGQIHEKSIFYVVLISILHLISVSAYFIFYSIINVEHNDNTKILENYQMDWLIGIDITTRHFFSRIILKNKIYKHHIFALIICALGFFFMTFSDFISIIYEKKEIKAIYFALFILPRAILFPLADVYDKLLLTDRLFLPQNLMFYRGCIESLILIIASPILYFTLKLNFVNIIETDLKIRILINAGFLIFIFLKAFCLMRVIDIFNAQIVSFIVIAELLSGILNHFYKFIHLENSENEIMKDKYGFIIDIISLIIIMFGTLVYNEMIIINRCDLNRNTEIGIIYAGKREIDNIRTSNLEDSQYVYYNENNLDE